MPKPLDRFLAERCVRHSVHREGVGVLIDAYRRWQQSHGLPPAPPRQVAANLKRLGIQPQRLHGRRYYQGIRLRPQPEEKL